MPEKGAVLSPATSQAWPLPLPHTAINFDMPSKACEQASNAIRENGDKKIPQAVRNFG